jgi:hypothetical protein
MAVSKNTRKSDSHTNKLFQSFFQNNRVSDERERVWHEAVRHAGTGTPPLRFAVYEHPYPLNIHSQQLADLLKELNGFGLNLEISLYHDSLIQYVRAAVCGDLLEPMTGIEHTDAWLFEGRRKIEEKTLRDPDEVRFLVRDRELERIEQGLPPRIQFLDDAAAAH